MWRNFIVGYEYQWLVTNSIALQLNFFFIAAYHIVAHLTVACSLGLEPPVGVWEEEAKKLSIEEFI